MEIKGLINQAGKAIKDNSPVILTGIAVGGVVTTSVMAVKATPRALYLIELEEERQYKLGMTNPNNVSLRTYPPISKMDAIKVAWRPFIPAAMMGTTTILCIIGAATVQHRRNAAIMGLYTITETTLKDYQNKVVETIGESKEAKIRESISEDRLQSTIVTESNVLQTGKGDTLFFESLSGRYFKSDMQNVRTAVNDFNESIIHGWSDTINAFYSYLNIPSTDLGRTLGWDTESMLDVNYTSKIADNGQPCIVIEYVILPKVI